MRGQPVAAQHFLTYRSEASSTADGTYWIKRIPRPILMVRDAGDTVIQPFEPEMLLSAANSEGSLVCNIKYVLLPNAKGPNPGGHFFSDTRRRSPTRRPHGSANRDSRTTLREWSSRGSVDGLRQRTKRSSQG